MIPKVVKSRDGVGTGGSGFSGLVHYVCGKADAVMTCNMVGEWREAPAQMRIVANGNGRVKKPAWHCLISWHEHERPDNEQMMEAALAALQALGAEEHQSVIAIHRDRDHHHVHIVINRIHPVTRKALNTGHDFARLERVCREMELAGGWTRDRGRWDVEIVEKQGKPAIELVPHSAGHWQRIEAERARGRRPDSRAERLREKRTAAVPLKDLLTEPAMKKRVLEALDARTWEAVQQQLGALGLEYRRHGSGARLYVRGSDDYMSPSHIGKLYALRKMEARLGVMPDAAPPCFPAGKADPEAATVRPVTGSAPSETTGPNRSQLYKAKLIAGVYRGIILEPELVAALHYVALDDQPPWIGLKGGIRIHDMGERITASQGKPLAASAMAAMAVAKGWKTVHLTGSPDFLASAAREMTRKGISIADADFEMQQIIRQTRKEIAREQSDAPAGNEPVCGFEAARMQAQAQTAQNRLAREQLENAKKALAARQKQRREDGKALLSMPGPVGQAARLALERRERAERQALRKEQNPLPAGKIPPADFHAHLLRSRQQGRNSTAARELAARKLRQYLRDNSRDALEGASPDAQQHENRNRPPSPREYDHVALRQKWEASWLVRGTTGYAEQSGISPETLDGYSDRIRLCPSGAMLFAHRNGEGRITGFEMDGPEWSGFARGGNRSLCCLGEEQTARRIVMTDTAMNALSLAEIEGHRRDTLYVSTGGNPQAPGLALLQTLASGRELVIAMTSGQIPDEAFRKLAGLPADRIEYLAANGPVEEPWTWNDVLRATRDTDPELTESVQDPATPESRDGSAEEADHGPGDPGYGM